jgi:hypothetical protein
MEGGLWKVDQDFNPILRLKNVLLKQSLNVTPTLYFADGTEYQLPSITLEPAGVAQVNIRIALQSVPADLQSHISTFGMAGISYQWSWPAVIATIQNTDEISSLTITSSLLADVRKVHAAPEASSAQVTRGQWWLPTASADGYVVLENTSMTPKQAIVQFSGHGGNALAMQQVSLPSHATSLVRLSTALGDARGTEMAGGVEIHYAGPDHGVVAYAGIEDDTVGYSASPILIEDHLDPERPVHQVTLSAPGLLLGNADPAMLFPSGTYFKPYAYLYNVSTNPLQVSLSLVSPGGGETPQTRSLGQVSLQPGETSQFDFESQFSSATPLPNGYGHLTASFQGHDGDLQIAAGSVDQSQTYVFEVTPSQQADSASRTLCFWSVEGDNDSMITVWNYKAVAQDLVLTLYYSGGHYAIPIHLAARQTYNLDMMTLIRSQVPDPDGTLIPSNISSGSAILSGPGGTLAKISVAVTASVYNVRNATCGVTCTTCNGVSNASFFPGNYAMPVQGTAQAYVQMTTNTGEVTTNPSGATWSTNNSSVVTVGNSSGVLAGVAVGQTTATWEMGPLFVAAGNICSPNTPLCPVYLISATSGGITVPSLSCTSPVVRGQSTTCTVTGPSGESISGWKFTDGSGNTVTSSSTSSTWSGMMVASGTVSVTAAGSVHLTSTIAVNSRPNFAFTAVNPSQQSGNSITCYSGTTTNLPSPPIANSLEGSVCANMAYSFNYATVNDGGPNNGYEYVTSASNSNGGNPTAFDYIVVSDLLSATTFYNAQCGNFSSSNAAGFIAGSQLKQNVFDHESGSILSHWTEYVNSQNNSSNNIGTVLESTTAPPDSTGSTFAQNAGNAALSRIAAAVANEPCSGSVAVDSSQSCAACGAINFSPYAACNGQPVPYCN